MNKINNGKSYIIHINPKYIKDEVKKGFTASSSFEKISNIDVIIICVPTPLKNNNIPDLSFIINTMKSINNHIHSNQLIVFGEHFIPWHH